jgi:steroid delta-isomerase-like uncharacterized protein
MAASNKDIAKRLRQEIWNTGNLAIADQICAEEAVFYQNDPQTPDIGRGPSALKSIVTKYRTAFPDAHITIEDIVAEGDRVAIRWTGRGTNKGNLGRISSTGKLVTVTGIDIVRISNGKVYENWTNWDKLGMLQQLGIQHVATPAA